MPEYYIFEHRKFDPKAYHFASSPFRDEIYPVFDWDGEKPTGDFLVIEASTPGMALARFWEYQNVHVYDMGESDWMAVEANSCVLAHYTPPKLEGTQYIEEELDV